MDDILFSPFTLGTVSFPDRLAVILTESDRPGASEGLHYIERTPAHTVCTDAGMWDKPHELHALISAAHSLGRLAFPQCTPDRLGTSDICDAAAMLCADGICVQPHGQPADALAAFCETAALRLPVICSLSTTLAPVYARALRKAGIPILCNDSLSRSAARRLVASGVFALIGSDISDLDCPLPVREKAALSEPRSIAVEGGGVLGMSLAVLAAERGHRVSIFEPSGRLGGKARRTDSDYLHELTVKLSRLENIELCLGSRLNPERFDTVIYTDDELDIPAAEHRAYELALTL